MHGIEMPFHAMRLPIGELLMHPRFGITWQESQGIAAEVDAVVSVMLREEEARPQTGERILPIEVTGFLSGLGKGHGMPEHMVNGNRLQIYAMPTARVPPRASGSGRAQGLNTTKRPDRGMRKKSVFFAQIIA
ncbi:MAG: hypothetical protein ACKOAG_10695 [Candidatus Kapaibacterium sp.]